MAGGFIYFWRSYTATISGSAWRRVQCVGCARLVDYQISCTASGRADSPFYLANKTAQEKADERARRNLSITLREAVEPVYCPTCGTYQPDMVQELYRRFGKNIGNPNQFAIERVEIPFRTAWRRALESNSVASYEHFIQVWPTEAASTQQIINELKRSPFLRAFYKLLPKIFWVIWAIIVGSFLAMAYATISHHG